MDLASLKSILRTLPITAIRYYPTTGSTNEDALKWANADVPDSALVVADHQTSGRGRLGRKWVTTPGSSLAFTVIFHPTLKEKKNLALFSLLGALAVSQAIQNKCGILARVKWPNDVLLNRQKVCGVLAESLWVGIELTTLVLGIGVNIGAASIPLQKDLLFPATCLESECGHPIDRELFLKDVLSAIFKLRKSLCQQDFIDLWESQLAFIGENIRLELPEQKTISGVMHGIDRYGNLRVLMAGGEENVFSIGDVKLRPV